MRWLAYLVVVLSLLVVGLSACSPRRSDGPPPTEKDPGQPAQPHKAKAPSEGEITVEGDGLSPEAKRALAEGFRKLLSDAIHDAINKGAEELFQKLRISDDAEWKLLAAADFRDRVKAEPDPDPDGPFVWAIHLIRPGPPDRLAETIEVTGEKPMTLRWTRAFARVERPVAVATLTWIHAGQLRQREKVLVFGPDSEWHAAERDGTPDRSGGK